MKIEIVDSKPKFVLTKETPRGTMFTYDDGVYIVTEQNVSSGNLQVLRLSDGVSMGIYVPEYSAKRVTSVTVTVE